MGLGNVQAQEKLNFCQKSKFEDQRRVGLHSAAPQAQDTSMTADVNMGNVGDADAPPSKHTACVRDLETSESHGGAVVSSHTHMHGSGEGVRPAAGLSSVPCAMAISGAPDVSGVTTMAQTVRSDVHDIGKIRADSVGGEQVALQLPEHAALTPDCSPPTVHGNNVAPHALWDDICSVCHNRADRPFMGGALCTACEMNLAQQSARPEDVIGFFDEVRDRVDGYGTATTSPSTLSPSSDSTVSCQHEYVEDSMDDDTPVHERGHGGDLHVDVVTQPVHERGSSTVTPSTVTRSTVTTATVTMGAVDQPVHERTAVGPNIPSTLAPEPHTHNQTACCGVQVFTAPSHDHDDDVMTVEHGDETHQ